MRKKLLTMATTGLMALSMAFTSFAGTWKQDSTGHWYQNDDGSYTVDGWQWIDGNNDGTAECYYFDANGYMLANTTTPDGYQVNSDGAWVVNGVVQTRQNGNSTSQERFVESDALPNMIIPTNGFQGTYHLTREMFEGFKAQSPNANPNHVTFGNWVDNCYYTYKDERFTLGEATAGDLIQKSGKWLIDTSKQDAMNGKTNIRFLYDDGTFAGLGFHAMKVGKNAQLFDSVYDSPEAMLYSGANSFYFSEDGYLMRNCYVQSDYSDVQSKIGCEGGWVDRNY